MKTVVSNPVGDTIADQDARGADRAAVETSRKVWSKPVLTIRSIEDVTAGTRSSVRLDDGNFFS